jgi:hypothetical protein
MMFVGYASNPRAKALFLVMDLEEGVTHDLPSSDAGRHFRNGRHINQ